MVIIANKCRIYRFAVQIRGGGPLILKPRKSLNNRILRLFFRPEVPISLSLSSVRHFAQSTLTFIPRLIYNRTVRAIETFRHRDDINLVELVNRHEEIEARFERRRAYLKRACTEMRLNRTLNEGEINTLAGKVLAGKNQHRPKIPEIDQMSNNV